MYKVLIWEDGGLRDIIECREQTVIARLEEETNEYKKDLIIGLLKELRRCRNVELTKEKDDVL